MNRSAFAFSAFLFLTLGTPAHAEDGCTNPKTPYDATYCLAKLFLESDKELNDVYKDLRAFLKDLVKKDLTNVQRQWIQYRDETCSPKAGTIDVDCNYKVNKERAEYLRDRLRECKTDHCQNDKIGMASWTATTQ